MPTTLPTQTSIGHGEDGKRARPVVDASSLRRVAEIERRRLETVERHQRMFPYDSEDQRELRRQEIILEKLSTATRCLHDVYELLELEFPSAGATTEAVHLRLPSPSSPTGISPSVSSA